VNNDASYANRALVVEIKRRLPLVQQVFILLLSDPKTKHLSRESCCLGLAACRGIAGVGEAQTTMSDELNHRLLRAFGQTTNFGGSAMMETQAQAAHRRAAERAAESGTNPENGSNNLMEAFGVESEVGGVSGLSEAALGAYREMAAASVSLGRHDILYALLILSVSHACWFSPDMKDLYRYETTHRRDQSFLTFVSDHL
jgi:proteasome component ECM29